MPKRDVEHYIVDVLVAIYKVNHLVRSFFSKQELLRDFRSYDAVLRELQVIGEAIGNLIRYKILNEQYRPIVDFRNKITHEYFGIDIDIVWSVLREELPLLDKVVHELVLNYSEKNSLIEAIDCALIDHQRMQQGEIEDFLKKLKKKFI
ncbi:MAG: DUF86 domain-containing protein [Chlamydiae bacterium]|nr:DUF86 domain-containing protein [Chlamydiota bacterium]MBI3276468.1 DUF86 domain-containing protein [Chlamydiota bacterium]